MIFSTLPNDGWFGDRGIGSVSLMLESRFSSASLFSPFEVCDASFIKPGKFELLGPCDFFKRSKIHEADENCGVYEGRGIGAGELGSSLLGLFSGHGSMTVATGEYLIIVSPSFDSIGVMAGNVASILRRHDPGIIRVIETAYCV